MTVTAASSDDSTATTAPSDDSTATASPDAEETEAPAEATTLGEFVSLAATKADTLTAVFDSAVPTDATVVVENQYGTVSGSSEISDTTITFTGTASFSEDTYTMTVSYGDASKSMSVEVVAEYVASIEIVSDEALTGGTAEVDGKDISNVDAYIYYEVYNQYGESLKETTTVTWTISSGDSYSVDKSKGRITVSKKSEAWTYGDLIAVVGVYVGSSGKTANVTKTVTVGLAQALDKVEFVGFLNTDDMTTYETTLPVDFAKDKWYLLYTAKDQQGNVMDADAYVTNKNVTFVSDAPLLIDSTSFEDGGVMTVNSVDYASVTIQPGTYVDKGGEVNITAISTGTGTKTTQNYVIGANGVLQSLVLQAPSTTIANGDKDVTLSYEATDTEGNSVTNYETIVRSSNTLTIKASEGTITIAEGADGNAKITWSDEYTATDTSSSKYVFAEANKGCYDGTDSLVSLTTVVVGGESNNTMITVSDARMPAAISSYSGGSNGNYAEVEGDRAWLNMSSMTILDQYGVSCAGWDGWMSAYNTWTAENAIGNYVYAMKYTVATSEALTVKKVTYEASNDYAGTYTETDQTGIIRGWDNYVLDAETLTDVTTCALTVSLVKILASDLEKTTYTLDDWDSVSKNLKGTFTIIPQEKVTGAYISGLPSIIGITTDLTEEYANGAQAEATGDYTINTEAVSEGAWLAGKSSASEVTVKGSYNGLEVTCPDWELNSETVINKSLAVSGTAVTWEELYDVNTARLTRITATKKMILDVTDIGTISAKVEISDAPSVLTEMGTAGTTVTPSLTEFTINSSGDSKDQYGCVISVDHEYKINTYKEASDYCHLTGTTITGNGTSEVKVKGAEIGDYFEVTETATDSLGTEMTKTYTVTVLPDGQAKITSESGGEGTLSSTNSETDVTTPGTLDKGLREVLGYDR